MTGRELIMYILANGLEDEQVVKDGKPIGFITVAEVAKRSGVGTATVHVWIAQGMLDCVSIGGTIFIPANFKSPIEDAM